MTITANNVIKEYASYSIAGKKVFRALDNVSISVKTGSIFGLLGQNGAGKTTLIKLLMGLVYAQGGEVQIFGKEPDVETRKRIGYLPENPSFPSHLTGRESLLLYGRLSGMPAAMLESRIQQVTRLLEINEFIDRLVIAYSKGMKQRLGLAQAMLHDPELLILDEPTDGVDPLGRKTIREILKDLRAAGKTIFINSHILSEVEMISDSVAILSRGKVLYEGNMSAMMQAGMEFTLTLENPITAIDPVLLQAFPTLRLHEGNTLRCTVEDSSALNTLLLQLIQGGYTVLEMQRNKQNLEQIYVQLLEGAKK